MSRCGSLSKLSALSKMGQRPSLFSSSHTQFTLLSAADLKKRTLCRWTSNWFTFLSSKKKSLMQHIHTTYIIGKTTCQLVLLKLSCVSEGQTNLKWFFQANVFSKKRTNKFDFTTWRLFSFIFWKKMKTLNKKTFRN